MNLKIVFEKMKKTKQDHRAEDSAGEAADEDSRSSGVVVSDDEISVGCPSPMPGAEEEINKKKKKATSQQSTTGITINSSSINQDDGGKTKEVGGGGGGGGSVTAGVRSFSILDILNHRPSAQPPVSTTPAPSISPNPPVSAASKRRKSSSRQRVLC